MSLPSARGTGNDGVNGVKKTWYEIDPEKRVVMEDLCDLLSGRRRGDAEETITPMLRSTLSPCNTAQKNFLLVYTSPDDKQVLAWGSGEIANDGFKSLTIHDRSVISRPTESLDHMMLQDMLRRGEMEACHVLRVDGDRHRDDQNADLTKSQDAYLTSKRFQSTNQRFQKHGEVTDGQGWTWSEFVLSTR